MNRSITAVLATLIITVGCTAGIATAETGTIAKVAVPFEFSIGDRTYPAGNYSLAELRPNLIALYDQNGRNVGLVLASVETTLEPPSESKLKFELVDGRHILAEVWTAGETTGSVFSLKGSKHPAAEPSSAMRPDDATRNALPRSK